MAKQDAPPEVFDDVANSRFAVVVDGHVGRIDYHLNGERLVLIHTEVPEALGGRGLAGVLVRGAIAHAAAEDLVVVPRCEYARKWLEEHPDVAATVTIDWN